MNAFRLLPIVLFASVLTANPEDKPAYSDALFFDKPVVKDMAIHFEIEEDLYPTRGSFKIQDFAFLSNELGERWALVIVRNTAPDPRTISENQIIALFADGTHRKPINLKKRIEGSETETFMIPFGKSKMPLVKLLTREF